MAPSLSWSARLLERFRSAPARWASGALLAGLVLTATGMVAVDRHQRGVDARELDRHLERHQRQMAARLDGYEDLLRAARSLVGRGPSPSPDRWRTFVEGLDLPQRHPGLKTLVVIERAPRPEPGAHSSVRALAPGDAGPDASFPESFLITLAEPASQASRAVGMDVATSAHQREAALRALEEGRPVVSAPLRFGSGPTVQSAVAFFMPLYRGSGVPATPEARRREGWGWISAGLYLQDLLGDLEGVSEPGCSVEVWDQGPSGPRRLHPVAQGGERLPVGPRRTFEAGGRPWTLALRTVPAGLVGRRQGRILWVLGAGLALTASLALALGSLVGARDRAKRLADQLTRTSRETLRRFETLMAQTPVGVIEWDARLHIRRWNPAAERIFGFGEGEVLDHSGSSLRLPGSRRDDVRASLEEVVREGQGLTRTLAGQRKDGEPVVCEWTSTPIYGADGRMEGVISLVLDVTEQRRTEERLWLHQKLESLGVMAGGIAHDFNNLLWVISGNAELARDRVGPEGPARLNLERIEAAAFRAAALARQLMIYTGRAPFVTQPIDPRRLLDEAQALAAGSLPSGVALEVAASGDLPAMKADGPQLQQALQNLLNNAIEAAALGRGRVTLRALAVDADAVLVETLVPGSALLEGPAVVLEVADEGPGIDPAHLPRIFDPFFSTKGTGRGLGLSATLGILRAHRGGLAVESIPGEGSCFRMFLPAIQGAVEDVTTVGVPTAPLAEAGRILLAEDEPVLRGLVVEALEPFGFQVVTVQDCPSVRERLTQAGEPFAAVVLDLRLEGERLEACLRSLRTVDSAVPVLLCTSSSQGAADLPAALRPAALLTKPYRLRELVALVQEHARKA